MGDVHVNNFIQNWADRLNWHKCKKSRIQLMKKSLGLNWYNYNRFRIFLVIFPCSFLSLSRIRVLSKCTITNLPMKGLHILFIRCTKVLGAFERPNIMIVGAYEALVCCHPSYYSLCFWFRKKFLWCKLVDSVIQLACAWLVQVVLDSIGGL